jgi:translation initiation factor 4B
MLPSPKSDLDRIARNLAADHAPDFHGVNKLYVGNLDFDTTEDDFLEFFERGENSKLCDVSIITGADGRSRGFGFVSFMPGSELEEALAMDGKECRGRELSVREPNNQG